MARRRRQTRGRASPLVIGVLIVIVGAIALERLSILPEPLAQVVRAVAQQLAPVLRDAGINLPDRQGGVPPAGQEGAADRAAASQALALVDRIPVQPEHQGGFDRDDWPHWRDQDSDCMDTRQEVLREESLEPVQLSRDGCRAVGGLWQDAYTGESFRDPSQLDVDHLVPLAQAYRSGGYAWSREQRADYANDLQDSRTLIAVSASANRSKADQGPEEWRPPVQAYLCRYVVGWVGVKARWSLSMDERERVTVGNILQACANG